MATPVQLRKRELKPHKATISPLLNARTVLTKSPWEFVSLWLTRGKSENARFYWDQARRFAVAAAGMPLSSAPLLHYYSFMNAAKALLAAKQIPFNELHGVGAHNMRRKSSRIDLSNEGVQIRTKGILPALASYLGDM